MGHQSGGVRRSALLILSSAAALLGVVGCTPQLGDLTPSDTDTSEDTQTSSTELDSGVDGATEGGVERPPDGGLAAHCSNQELDEDEPAVDCGGSDCPKCGLRQPCSVNADCESNLCNGTCLPTGCGNGVMDGSETDVDCGGSCSPCADGAQCMIGAHCVSRVCTEGFCLAPTCEDTVANGTETDKDCGGDECKPCSNGDACKTDDDCSSEFCGAAGICVDPGCGDGSKNGDESDVDCGGSCSPCEAGDVCSTADDCASKNCDDKSLTCVAPSCEDEILNGDESDADCGGGCAPCEDGATCTTANDCLNKVCEPQEEESICAEPSCTDEVSNGEETGIDCGGEECSSCGEGQACRGDTDCASGYCLGVCVEATCDDDYKNQDETDIDCGGNTCEPCGAGEACGTASDCRSNDCAAGACLPSAADEACVIDSDCITGRCLDDSCAPGFGGTGCFGDGDCVSGSCTQGMCTPGATGDACEVDSQCHSEHCRNNGTCGKGAAGSVCSEESDCVSDRCSSGRCLATRLAIQSANVDPSVVVGLQLRVDVTMGDPALPWNQLAFLYFFSPEARVDYYAEQYNGPTTGPLLAFRITDTDDNDWMFQWRAQATDGTYVASQTFIDFRLRDTSGTFNQANDYSYTAMNTSLPNPNIVVCQQSDGRWKQIQGTPPMWATNPCRYVVDSCANSVAEECDNLAP